jgi:hypothetical protein
MSEKTLDLARCSDAAIDPVLPRNPTTDPALWSRRSAHGLVEVHNAEVGLIR